MEIVGINGVGIIGIASATCDIVGFPPIEVRTMPADAPRAAAA